MTELRGLITKRIRVTRPMAWFVKFQGMQATYRTEVLVFPEDEKPQVVTFLIPAEEMGDASFDYKIPASLLLRWLQVSL